MREIFIKYNPYKVETNIEIDGKNVKKNSALNIGDRRLQEWIEDLPDILVNECNTKQFNVIFHGTMLDYEDLLSVTKQARDNGIEIRCEHVPAKEVHHKEQAIAEIFEDIQNGPFQELKQSDVIKAFEIAKSSEFPVNVVATMSAGKSTLINALLRQRLMPAKQEACTATITEIKDIDLQNFRATVFCKDGELIETHPELSYEIMDSLNSNPIVSTIRAEGDIPFVSSEDVSLVLVDTPGPNNSRDPEHKAATYRMLSESSKTVVLYILNATQLAVNDDNNLLNHVADSMRVGGKQSKDRFIFVVNKLDDFKKGEDSVESAIEKVRKYLEDKGIENPNIFPASALTALDIRTGLEGIDFDNVNYDEIDPEVFGTIGKVKKIINNPELHLANYAPLPPSVRGEITRRLTKAKENNDKKEEALIHTGIIPIEAAINMYVEKYAKTAKIKNIVDTFSKKLEDAESFETVKQKIVLNKEKQKDVLDQIEIINKKLKNGEEAKKFKEKIERINYDKEIKSVANSVINEAQKKISEQLSSNDVKLSRRDAESICHTFSKFAENLQAEVQVKLESVVTTHVEQNATALLEEYKQKVVELSNDIDIKGVQINPFELIGGEMGNISNSNDLVKGLAKSERVKVDEVWVENSSKKWYKPWTWLQESGHYKDVYEDREYVDGSELARKFFAPIQKQLFTNSDAAVDYAKSQAKAVKNAFSKKFDDLDKVLNDKLSELEKCASEEADIQKVIAETNTRLEWLESIQARMKAILEV